MADYGEYFDSDQDSNDHIDHIPKTPGPVTLRDHESEDDQNSGEDSPKKVKHEIRDDEDDDSNHNESGSNEESEEEEDEDDERKNEQENSEVERSDGDEDEEQQDVHHSDEEKASSHDEQDEDDQANQNLKAEHSDEEEEENDEVRGKSDDESKSEEEDDHDKEVSDNESQKSDHEQHDEEKDKSTPVQSPIANEKKSRKLEITSDSDDEDADNEGKEHKRLKIDDSDEEQKEDEDEDNQEDVEKSENDSKSFANQTASAKDIFGDISSEEEEPGIKSEKKFLKSSDDEKEENEMEESEIKDEQSQPQQHQLTGIYMEEEIEEIPETRIDVEIPRIVANLGDEISFVKLPNFLSVDTHPYDPSWYEEEGLDDEEYGIDDEGRARVKLKVENTIRWRNTVDENGVLKKESNSRIVRWSDGSLSLHLGSETFDIYKNQLMAGDNNHLFIRQGTGLQGQAVFRNKLTFRPHSTDSFTHTKMTSLVADRNQRTQKIRVLPTVGRDPEAHRSEMIKKEEDKLKASIRRESKIRRTRDRNSVRGPTASYLEPDDDEEEGAISLSAIKNKYKKGALGYNVYTDSEESAGDEKEAKSSENNKIVEEDDDSDLELDKKRSAEKKKPVKIVDSDDEDE